MPLGKDVSANMREMYADNKRKGKARGAGGKVRSRAQMIAIAMSAAGKSKNKAGDMHKMPDGHMMSDKEMMMKMRASRGHSKGSA